MLKDREITLSEYKEWQEEGGGENIISYLDYIQTALQLNKDNFVKAFDKSMDLKEEERGALEDVRFQCIQDDFDRLMEDYRFMRLKVNELHDNYNNLTLDSDSIFSRIDELKKEYRQAAKNEKKS